MSDVKQRAEAEAVKKGLSGAQEQAYVGGVFNRIRQAHARATTPGTHGARRLLKRAARREARAEAQEQIRYHEQQIAGLKEGIHLRARLDEPRKKGEGKAGAPRQPATREEQIAEAGGYVPKTPIMELRKLRPRQLTDEQLARDWESAANWPVQSAGVERRKQALEREMARRREAQAAPAAKARPRELEPLIPMEPLRRDFPDKPFDPYAPPDPQFLIAAYGSDRLAQALQGYSVDMLKLTAAKLEAAHPGTKPTNRADRKALINYIVRYSTGEPSDTAPAQPAQPAAVARPAARPAERPPTQERELSFKEKGKLFDAQRKREQREREEAAKKQREQRYQRNLVLKQHGYQWRKAQDVFGPSDNGDTAGVVWQLYDAEGKPVSEAEALRRINQQ